MGRVESGGRGAHSQPSQIELRPSASRRTIGPALSRRSPYHTCLLCTSLPLLCDHAYHWQKIAGWARHALASTRSRPRPRAHRIAGSAGSRRTGRRANERPPPFHEMGISFDSVVDQCPLTKADDHEVPTAVRGPGSCQRARAISDPHSWLRCERQSSKSGITSSQIGIRDKRGKEGGRTPPAAPPSSSHV